MEADAWAAVPCHIAPQRPTTKGYVRLTRHGRKYRAHRLAYEDAYGPIPEGMCVCHHCDNRACIEPLHLFLGTHADNVKDRDAKGRQARGERMGNGKLSDVEWADLVRKYLDGWLIVDLAAVYGVHQSSLGRRLKRYGVRRLTGKTEESDGPATE